MYLVKHSVLLYSDLDALAVAPVFPSDSHIGRRGTDGFSRIGWIDSKAILRQVIMSPIV